MGHLNPAVRGLGIQDPAVLRDPAIRDGGLGSAHEVFLIHRSDEDKSTLRFLAVPGLESHGGKGGQGAGEAGFHVAGSPAVDAAFDYFGAKGGYSPALPGGDSVHVADIDERGSLFLPLQPRHDVKTAREDLLFDDGNVQAFQILENEFSDFSFIGAGIGAVDANQVHGQLHGV